MEVHGRDVDTVALEGTELVRCCNPSGPTNLERTRQGVQRVGAFSGFGRPAVDGGDLSLWGGLGGGRSAQAKVEHSAEVGRLEDDVVARAAVIAE